MPSMSLWAEFTEVLRLPLGEDDFVRAVPWDRAGFQEDWPLLDVGAGAGHGTVALAEAIPGAEILAVEPDPDMRALLMLRLAERDRLRPRVTVLPDNVLDAPLPDRLGGAVLLSVIYLLDEDQRRQLWRLLADLLEPGAPVLLNRSFGPQVGEAVPAKLVSSAELGRQRYERWFEATPDPDGVVQLRNTYRVFLDEALVREETALESMTPLSEQTVLAEVPEELATEALDERFLVVRRR